MTIDTVIAICNLAISFAALLYEILKDKKSNRLFCLMTVKAVD